jgi:EF-hand domain pair
MVVAIIGPRLVERTMRRLVQLLALTVLLPLVLPAPASSQKSSIAKRADPAGTGPLMGQLRALFAEWDANRDGYLDPDELAKGFRGPDAKPAPADLVKAKGGTPPPAKSKDKPAGKEHAAYPDHQFLVHVDQDGDGKVSRDEFVNWGREYAVLQKNLTAAEGRVVKAETNVRTKTAASSRAKAELEWQAERQKQEKLVAQLPPFEKALQQVLKPATPAKKGKK